MHFTERVEGPDPVEGDRYWNDWHSFIASAMLRQDDEAVFVHDDEIIERWPTRLISRVEWFPLPARPGRRAGQGETRPGYSLADKRRTHTQAYARWTQEEEDQLRAEHAEGLSIPEISKQHGRNEGAIRSRLVRLGLLTPDAP